MPLRLLTDGVTGRGAELPWEGAEFVLNSKLGDFYPVLCSYFPEVSELASRFPGPDKCVF